MIIFGLYDHQLLSSIKEGVYTSQAEALADLEARDARGLIIGIALITLYVATGILFLSWTYRANRNARHLGAKDMRFTPGWSIGWYFVPVGLLWKPYQALVEIWKASKNPTDWKNQESSGLVRWYWYLWIFSELSSYIAGGKWERTKDIDGVISANMASVFSCAVDMPLALIAIAMISRIFAMQTGRGIGVEVPDSKGATPDRIRWRAPQSNLQDKLRRLCETFCSKAERGMFLGNPGRKYVLGLIMSAFVYANGLVELARDQPGTNRFDARIDPKADTFRAFVFACGVAVNSVDSRIRNGLALPIDFDSVVSGLSRVLGVEARGFSDRIENYRASMKRGADPRILWDVDKFCFYDIIMEKHFGMSTANVVSSSWIALKRLVSGSRFFQQNRPSPDGPAFPLRSQELREQMIDAFDRIAFDHSANNKESNILFSGDITDHPNSDEVEKEVEELYSRIMFQEGTGMTQKQARVSVREAIALCKAQSIKEGTASLPNDYGDLLLKATESGDPDSKTIVDKARNEGATDDDIREYWNLPDLMRRMVHWSENVFRVSFTMGQWDHDLSKNEAAIQIRKAFPMYGDPADVHVTSGEDRPLPQELRGRVDRWRMRIINERGGDRLKAQLEKYSSFNALVREEIRRGNL